MDDLVDILLKRKLGEESIPKEESSAGADANEAQGDSTRSTSD